MVVFGNNDKRLASSGDDNLIFIWDIEKFIKLWELKNHIDSVFSLAFTADGESLASGSMDGTTIIWNLDNCKVL